MVKLKTKKLLIILIIFIDILLICITGIIYLHVKKDVIKDQNLEYMYNITSDEPSNTLEKQKVTSITNFMLVEKSIQNYYNMINIENDILKRENNENIVKLLSEEYIKQNGISSNNINQYIKGTNKKLEALTLNMSYIKEDNMYKYSAYGILIDDNNKLIDNFYIYVNLDMINKTFSIEPISEKKYEEKMILNIQSIEANNYNQYIIEEIGTKEVIQYDINRFKKLSLVNPELTYNLLEESYKKARFLDINKYKEFIQNNKDRIANTEIEKYAVKYEKVYEEYICVDKNGFYYIIRQDVNDNLNYKFILDSYSIDMTETIDRYDKSTVKEKIAINIGKIIEAINLKDYEYIYSKLDNNFRSKYFKDEELLGDFLQQNMYEINKITGGKFSENGNDIYTYELKISSNDEENKKTKDMTIIMKLLENRDFVMSFSL